MSGNVRLFVKHCLKDAPVSVRFFLFSFLIDVDADRARKHGMDEFIHSDPSGFDHSALFDILQELTLDHRLNDSYSCLVS